MSSVPDRTLESVLSAKGTEKAEDVFMDGKHVFTAMIKKNKEEIFYYDVDIITPVIKVLASDNVVVNVTTLLMSSLDYATLLVNQMLRHALMHKQFKYEKT